MLLLYRPTCCFLPPSSLKEDEEELADIAARLFFFLSTSPALCVSEGGDKTKPTVALDYMFARRSTGGAANNSSSKDIAHIWDLGE